MKSLSHCRWSRRWPAFQHLKLCPGISPPLLPKCFPTDENTYWWWGWNLPDTKGQPQVTGQVILTGYCPYSSSITLENILSWCNLTTATLSILNVSSSNRWAMHRCHNGNVGYCTVVIIGKQHCKIVSWPQQHHCFSPFSHHFADTSDARHLRLWLPVR